ncbi:hypothetical protein SASPL_107959 [Salvia splendens]|uniref:GAG-pre-integrase domain-containing protein n=1 Tax=Salvia splendens TaxID=180675 RepID=A0A8X9A4X7_SALSN|nr:hypothetical protein SASPL_107959 [Salvia splendens]
MLCMSDDVIIEVADQETAAALWTKLESLYMTKSLTNKLLLKQRLFRLRMQEGTPLREHLENLNKILLDLHNVEVKVEDEDVALILLVSLPESYENFVESFMTGKETLSLEDVDLLSTSEKIGNRQLVQAQKVRRRDYLLRVRYDCPKKKKKEGKKGDVNGLATVAEANDSDSKEYFTTYEQIDGGNITMANSAVYKACSTYDELSTFDSKGFSFKGEDGVMHIIKGSKVVLTALKRGTLYILKGSIVTGSADTASSEIPAESMTELWHMRLGHMGERGMQILSKRDFFSGHKVKNLDFCKHCVFGKLHRNNRNVLFDENSMLNSIVKSVGTKDSGSVDNQVEMQVTHNQSESQLQGREYQHTTAETTSSDIHSEARQRSIAIDRARRTSVKPP